MAILGIDLGTTNSLGAVFRDGKVELVPNAFGSFLTPSVVSIGDEGEIIVGAVAKERSITHPECTAASFKKDMGTERKYKLGKRTFLPEELSSFVIRSIVEDAKAYLNEEIEEVIISVPAYFHDKQRVATKRAGALAGVTVHRILNEPSAAAMAAYLDTSEEQLCLIFDFGGGTLDVSVVDCFNTVIQILSVAGDNRLGGDNFHTIMAEAFLEENHLARAQLTDTEYAVLLRQAEKCKRKLTEEQTAEMQMTVQGKLYRKSYTDVQLMEDSSPLLKRIQDVLTRALLDGGLSAQDIDKVIMVGGSSKMPLMQSYVKHLFCNTPVVIQNCDCMIAEGLGFMCGVKARKEEIKDYVLTDICPFTLGIDVFNRADPQNSYMSPIIERNTVLPCSRVHKFSTIRDKQTKVDIDILQGEHVFAKENLCLGKITVHVPPNKAGKESVDVRFTYDLNGILVVDVTVLSTGQTLTKVISQTMSEEELQSQLKALQKLKIHPKNKTENVLLMEKLKALYEESPLDMREQIQNLISRFELLLDEQDPRKIERYKRYLEAVLAQMSYYDPFERPLEMEEYYEEDSEEETSGGGNRWMS